MNKWIPTLIVGGFVLTLTNSCKKEEFEIPVLITTDVTNITHTSAASGGKITSDGGSTISTQGVCWSTGQTPTVSDSKINDSSGARNYICNITGLISNTKYYVRAFATNNVGTAYGAATSFTTLQQPILATDIDGNVYNTVAIGKQVWMVENLKTTKYRNGDSIPKVIGEPWDNLITGAYCIYDNNKDNRLTYGLIYNWYATNDNRNICPEGWHIPTIEEWVTLTETGLELKESGTTHWKSPNVCLPNSSGFTALPGGGCGYDGNFNGITEYGYWWTADEENTENGWAWIISYEYAVSIGYINYNKWMGASIRCIKD